MSRSLGVLNPLSSFIHLLPPLATASKAATFKNIVKLRRRMAPRYVSPQMKAFLGGVVSIPRHMLRKEVLDYIRDNKLLAPNNKRIVICDEKLKTIFDGRDEIGLRDVDRFLEHHIYKRVT